MALLGTYGGADDVRVQANRLGAPQAGGIYGGSGEDLVEVYITNTEWIITQIGAKEFEVTGATSALDDNVTGGTLAYANEACSNEAYHWYLNGVYVPGTGGASLGSPPYPLAPFDVQVGDVVHCVRYGVSSVTGDLILSPCAPLIAIDM
jgi:hypothetical protein